MPEIVKAGKLYIGLPPLYKINTPNKTYYADTQEEIDKIRNKHGSKCMVTRFKGLGEMNPSDFRDTVLSKDSTMVRVKMKNESDTKRIVNMIQGKDAKYRKIFTETGAFPD